MTIRLEDIRYLLVDMDGVLYRGKTGLAGGPELIRFLETNALEYILLTNNSTLRPSEFVERLAGMGVHTTDEHVMTSGVATAEYLASRAPRGAKVNVIGEQALVQELEKRGFVMAGRDADYVVCGWDRAISFEKLTTACLAIRDGATFVGTNPDKTYPLERDIIPGAGSLLAALVAATDVEPIVVGKPQTIAIEQCLALMRAPREQTAMLGDRLDTDILGGHRAGIATIMVLTGISSAEEAASAEAQPDLIYENIPALLDAWRAALADSA